MSAFFFIDAEKAFDREERVFIKKVMQKRDVFLKWINLIYDSQYAIIWMEGHCSPKKYVQRWVRQGRPYSPLLFNIAIEEMALTVRSDDNIWGIQITGIHHKLALYADDVVFFLCDPLPSIDALMKILDSYSHILGYKMNVEISTFGYSCTARAQIFNHKEN